MVFSLFILLRQDLSYLTSNKTIYNYILFYKREYNSFIMYGRSHFLLTETNLDLDLHIDNDTRLFICPFSPKIYFSCCERISFIAFACFSLSFSTYFYRYFVSSFKPVSIFLLNARISVFCLFIMALRAVWIFDYLCFENAIFYFFYISLMICWIWWAYEYL